MGSKIVFLGSPFLGNRGRGKKNYTLSRGIVIFFCCFRKVDVKVHLLRLSFFFQERKFRLCIDKAITWIALRSMSSFHEAT